MKLEVGQFVRFKDKRGIEYIRKVIDGYKKGWYGCKVDIEANNVPYVSLKNVIKASFNIIDLIEEGDYINGHRVIFVNDTFTYASVNVETSGEATCEIIPKNNIKSIVTKEQFEQMSYKTGE